MTIPNNNLRNPAVPVPLRQLSNELSRIAVTYRAPYELTVAPSHPRVHTRRQIKQIAKSISVFGFLIPIVIDEASRVLVGVGRFLAAKELLSFAEIPTIQVTHLDEAQKKAFAIADNQLGTISKWDDPVLAEQLKELSIINLDFDLEVTGFEVAEIDLRIESLNLDVDDSDPADVLPAAVSGEPISRVGDIWVLGRHRLLCGDALDPAAYSTLMRGKKADMIFSDSPYNVKIDGHATGLGANRHREFAMASGEMTRVEFETFLLKACLLLARHSSDGSLHFLCMDWRHSGELLAAGRAVYSTLKNICVWNKSNAGMGSLYRSQHEFIFVFKNGHAPHRNNVQLGRFGRHRSNVWTYPGANSMGRGTEEGNLLALHPTAKPVKLVADAILDCSARGDLVLDPFMGSGTTLMAAERVGRRCNGIEIDPLYIDTIIRRWQAQTGDDAVHEATGRRFNDNIVGGQHND
jgi:DNA modification methylase